MLAFHLFLCKNAYTVAQRTAARETEMGNTQQVERVPLSARRMRGWQVNWSTATASGQVTTIARTFSEASQNIGQIVPGSRCVAKAIR